MPIDASLTPRRCALLILVILGIISLIVASFLSDLRLDTRESPGDYEASWSKETAGGTDGENGRFSAEKDTGSSPGYYMQHLHWFVQVRNFISHVENVLVSINTLPTKLYCSKYFTDNAEMLRIRVYFNFNLDTDDSFSRLIIINSINTRPLSRAAATFPAGANQIRLARRRADQNSAGGGGRLFRRRRRRNSARPR